MNLVKPFIILLSFILLIQFLSGARKNHPELSQPTQQTAQQSAPQQIQPQSRPINVSVFPQPKGSRTYHRCLYQNIPYISGIVDTAQYLESHPKASFVRFGNADIELMMMLNRSWQTADSSLSAALLEVLQFDDPNFMIGLPDFFSGPTYLNRYWQDFYYDISHLRDYLIKHIDINKQYFSTFITHSYVISHGVKCNHVSLAYNALRNVWKGKNLVILRGSTNQTYVHDIFDTARSQKVYFAPRYQAWTAFKELNEKMMKEDKSKLFILTCGPVGKVIAYNLYRAGRRALDLGHLPKDYNVSFGGVPLNRFFQD